MLVDTLHLLLRRWPAVLAAVFAASAAATAVFMLVPTQHESQAQVLFLGPKELAGVGGESNPFLSLGGSLGIAAAIVQIRVSDDDTSAALAADGATAKYVVKSNLGQNAGPILIVTSDDNSGQRAQATTAAVVARIQSIMTSLQRQSGAPAKLYITTTVLTSYPQPLTVYENRIRSAVVAAVLTLALWLGLIVVLEQVRQRRIQRQVGDHVDDRRGRVTRAAGQSRDRLAGVSTATDTGSRALSPLMTPDV